MSRELALVLWILVRLAEGLHHVATRIRPVTR